MNLYYAEFPGVYLGGLALVRASGLVVARRRVARELVRAGLAVAPDDVKLRLVDDAATFVLLWNGDY